MTRDGQNNLAEGEAEESNPFCVQGPDDTSEPVFSGFCDDEILVAQCPFHARHPSTIRQYRSIQLISS